MSGDLQAVQEATATLATAFEEFKQANDARLAEIEQKGAADAVTEEKVTKLNEALTRASDAVADLQKKQKAADDLRIKADAKAEAEAKSLRERLDKMETAARRPATESKDGSALSETQAAHKQAWLSWLRKGVNEHALGELEAKAIAEATETKALSISSDADGGYLVPPDMTGRIVTRLFDTSPIRAIANVVTISTDRLEGLRDTDQMGVGWVAEQGTRSETTTAQLGKWAINVHECYAEPRATQALLDDAAINLDQWVVEKVTERLARLEATAFVAGSGVGQPRGFTAYTAVATADASRSWGQLEYVASGTAGGFATTNGSDCLFDLVAAFKPGYLAGATWVTRRTVIQAIRKLKSGDGQYLWMPGLQAAQPSTLLGYPIVFAEDMPALANNSLSLALGNFREAYQIVDRIGIRVLRDPYSAKPYIKFYTTRRVGGDVVQFEAIKFIKFATS